MSGRSTMMRVLMITLVAFSTGAPFGLGMATVGFAGVKLAIPCLMSTAVSAAVLGLLLCEEWRLQERLEMDRAAQRSAMISLEMGGLRRSGTDQAEVDEAVADV